MIVFELGHSLKTSHLDKKIYLYHISHFLVISNNYVCSYSQLKISENLDSLLFEKMHHTITSKHSKYRKIAGLFVCNHNKLKMKDIVYHYISNCSTWNCVKSPGNQYNNLLKALLIFIWPWTDIIFNIMIRILFNNCYNTIFMMID